MAALGQWLDDPPRLAWGFLALFEDLVAPGAVYLLLPSTAGNVCRLLAGAGLDPDQERRLLEPLAALPYLDGGPPPVECRPIAWQPGTRPELVARHYPLAAPACGARGQWGMLLPRTIDRSHRNLFREASAELEKLLQVMATQQLLAAANRKLTEADEAKNAFILTLNHDLRSPLGALQLGLDAMELDHDQLPVPVRHWIEVGQRSVERLIRLVNGILDLGKMEAGSFSFEPVRVDARRPGPGGGPVPGVPGRGPAGAAGLPSPKPPRASGSGSIRTASSRSWSTSWPTPSSSAPVQGRCGWAWSGRVRPWSCRSRTRGRAFPRRSGTGSSASSSRPSARPAAPAWAWPSPASSPRPWAGTIGFRSEEGRGACFQVRFPAQA